MNIKENFGSIDRRSFLNILSFTGIAGLVYPRKLLSLLSGLTLSRVVLINESTATSGTNINAAAVQTMVNSGIKALTQIPNLGEAWKSVFPNITPAKVIAIKVNCINSSVPTHPEVTYAVANGLKQMDFNGTLFPENNIIIFDRRNNELSASGYTINSGSVGVRCFGTNSSGVGYSSTIYSVHGKSQQISKVVTDMADYLINISVLKNHSTAGVTHCLKNHYGTCHNPGAMHYNHTDPYTPALNALPVIQSIQVLNICDSLFGVVSGGPGGSPQIAPNKLIMSQDIVAVDYWGRDILDEHGCSTINNAHHIDTAAQPPYNLGTNNPAQMDIVNINEPVTTIGEPSGNDAQISQNFILYQNYPNPFNPQTRIRFFLRQPSRVKLEIFDSNGRFVKSLSDKKLAPGNHEITWNGTDRQGRSLSSGAYVCRLTSGEFSKAIIMTYAR